MSEHVLRDAVGNVIGKAYVSTGSTAPSGTWPTRFGGEGTDGLLRQILQELEAIRRLLESRR